MPAPPEVAEALQLAPSTETLFLKRLRATHGEPFAVMRNWMDAKDPVTRRVRSGGGGPLRSPATGRGLGRRRTPVRRRRGADAEEAQLLDFEVGSPVLTMTTTSYAGLGKPVEFGRHTYRPDRHHVEMVKVEK